MNRFCAKRFFLFDLDGTLVDSSGLHERVFRELLREQAPEILPRFDYECLKGRSTAEALLDLGVKGGARLEFLVAAKQQRYRDAVRTGELRLMPGTREALEFLRDQGHRMFVVTGGSRLSVEAALESTGIRLFFEGVVTADDVSRGKPAPEAYLVCLTRFGIPVAAALGIEDSANGYESCRAASLDAVLVSRGPESDFTDLLEFRDALVGEEFAVA